MDAGFRHRPWPGILAAYHELLPPELAQTGLTLREGGTPLIEARGLGARLGIRLFLKVEGQNPTGSFKDRGMVAAIAGALVSGLRTVICASTGNTAASAAAYAAKAGLDCFVVLPAGAVALGKVAQALAHGARLVPVMAGFDRALQLAREMAAAGGAILVNSLNPLRIEGQKTAAFEVADALGGCPDYLVLPVGNAGNIASYWRGFSQYLDLGRIATRPRVIGVQASGADPFVRGEPVDEPQTEATAIRIGRPAGWDGALQVRAQSGGMFVSMPDEQTFAAQRMLASEEGIFAEPASAAAVAGVIALAGSGALARGATVVAVLTGHGLKDPDAVLKGLKLPEPVEPTICAVTAAVAAASTEATAAAAAGPARKGSTQ